MKKFISLILSFVMVLSIWIPTYAANTTTENVKIAMPMAEDLSKLGILKGSDTGYELDRPITRAEAMVLIVRMIGKEYDAGAYTKGHPFTDVPKWASKYVAFSYDNGITSGTSQTKFGSNDYVTARQFLTFLFRALGYSEHFDDCGYDTILSFAQNKGLIKEGEYSDKTKFLRADVVILVTRALDLTYRLSKCTVRDILTSTKVPETGFVNTKGNGAWMTAGTFEEREGHPLPVIDKSKSFSGNKYTLNEYLWSEHGRFFVQNGIGMDEYSGAGVAKFIQNEDGRYGIKILGWRDEYDGLFSAPTLNVVLDALYFICGDKEVAYALWSCLDSAAINGHSDTNYFGFKDLYWNKNGGVIKMKNIEIEVGLEDGNFSTFYFK